MIRLASAVRVVILLSSLGVVLSGVAFAGSTVVGSVAGSVNATVGGRDLVPSTTIFSGDSLQVRDGVAVVALGRGSRMVFGRESTVSLSRETDSVTALLSQGNVSLFHPEAGTELRVQIGGATIAPAKGFKTMGEVAMVNGTVLVTTKEGLLRIEGDGQTVDVAKGKTVTVVPTAARAPQGGGGRGHGHDGHAFQVISLGAGAASVGLSAWAIHNARNSRDSANSSIASANAAAQAAHDAQQAAIAAQNSAVAAGCALNRIAAQIGILTSPFTPPAGYPPC